MIYIIERRNSYSVKMFRNKRFITKGVLEHIEPLLQVFMWQCIDNMPPPKDYLQVFTLEISEGKLKIKHSQEEPDYQREYLLCADIPFYVGKVFVIDDKTHSTMLLAEEY